MDQDLGALRDSMLSVPIADDSDPFQILEKWLKAAETAALMNPNAMVLATADARGVPSVRVLLLKEVRRGEGLVFYTSYVSPKAQDLEANPQASINFFWDALFRQVRVSGSVQRVSRQDSENYWNSRPFGSRVSQYVSTQSKTIESREELEARYAETEKMFRESGNIPCPEHWGGYILRPQVWEFWIADPVRFHYRYQFAQRDGGWRFSLLSP